VSSATTPRARAQVVASGFEDVASRFANHFDQPGNGGGALAVRWRGEVVLDIWAGTRDRAGAHPWLADTACMSFSTSKGVTSAAVHRMLDRHELDLDRPVAAYWPEFGAHGKGHVTLRQVLTHQAGIHNVRALVDDAWDLLDDEGMEARVAAAKPHPLPGTGPGYHAMTFGWIISGMLRALTGLDMTKIWQEELTDVIGDDGLQIGLAADRRADVAELVATGVDPMKLLQRVAPLTPWSRKAAEALLVPGFSDLVVEADQQILGARMPAVTGVFTARALAALYTGLGGAEINGQRLLSEPAADRLRIVQTKKRDYVLGIPMHWRLGYHRALMRGRAPAHAFGHYGFGGSGAWVDPVDDLAVGFVTNRLGTASTPIADPRFFGLSRRVVDATRTAPAPN
jgi:CubicO group peptidase (beta-lactamase class C family)